MRQSKYDHELDETVDDDDVVVATVVFQQLVLLERTIKLFFS